jgi:hypothetical protein
MSRQHPVYVKPTWTVTKDENGWHSDGFGVSAGIFDSREEALQHLLGQACAEVESLRRADCQRRAAKAEGRA